MSFSNGPTLVTNGLVLALDAGDRNSYVSGSSTWFDLIGSNNGTLTNGPTFNTGSGGNIVFDGVNDYATIPYTSVLAPALISFNTWVYNTNWPARTGNQKIFSKTQSGGYALGCTIFTADQLEFIAYIDGGYKGANYPLASLPSGWVNIQGSFNGRYLRLYINGVLVNTYDHLTTSVIGYTDNNHLVIAAEPGFGTGIDGNYFNGSIATTSIYNRALSAAEILQNYNAQKSKFGL